MKVAVTGGGGFLGRHLVRGLAGLGLDVVAVVRSDPPAEHAPFYASDKVRLVRIDLASPDFSALPRDLEAICSLAQSSRHRDFPAMADEIFAVNVGANLRLLQWAVAAKVRKFVLASSGGIYGSRGGSVMHETDPVAVDSPLGFYLGSKLCAEVVLQNYRQFFAGAAVLRPFFIYGPGQRADMLIPRLVASVREGRPISLQGSEGLRLNPVYVDDAVRAFSAALGLSGCHVLNVAGPETLTLREVGERIGRRLGRAPVFELAEGKPSDYVADIERMRSVLGAPRTLFDEGIARAIEAQ